MAKEKYFLDIGSSSVRLVATNLYNNKSRIIAEESLLYDGFMDGEFLSENQLDEVFSTIITNMQAKMRKTINKIFVGVPNDFCICVCKRISRKYSNLHKITEKDIVDLYQSNLNFGDSEEYQVINYSPMQYVLDNNTTTLSPVGKKTTSIVLDASYILAKNSFYNLVGEKLTNLGIKEIEFISTSLGQALCCNANSKKPIAIVDVGHISTSVSVLKGEGLALLSSFAIGGGHISADIMQLLNLSFKNAELIKRKVVLTISSTKNDYYEVCNKGELIKAPINITNQIVNSRIEMIAKVIKNILTQNNLFNDIDVYLTGDGICNFKGAKSILKTVTGFNILEFKIPFDNSNNKYQTSKIGLAKLVNEAI